LNKLIPLLAFSVLLLVPLDAAATTVIFDSGPPDNGGAFAAGVPLFWTDDFIPTMSGSVTDFHFFIGSNLFLTEGSTFAYEIRNNGPGHPGNIVLGAGTATVVEANSFPALCGNCFEISTDFDNPVPVMQGETYWILFEAKVGQTYIKDQTEVGAPFQLTVNMVDYLPTGGITPNFPMKITALLPIGGTIIPLDTTSLLLAGAQTFSWMIPVVISAVGIGLVLVRRK